VTWPDLPEVHVWQGPVGQLKRVAIKTKDGMVDIPARAVDIASIHNGGCVIKVTLFGCPITYPPENPRGREGKDG